MNVAKGKLFRTITLAFVSISLIFPHSATADIVMRVYSPNDTYDGANVSPNYDVTFIETAIESTDPDKIYFWIHFKNPIQSSQFVYGSTKPYAALQIFFDDPSSVRYASNVYLATNNSTPFSGNTSVTAPAFGNTTSGTPRTSLSSCNPEVWANLNNSASWIGFSISRSCAKIPNEFWLNAYTDADLGNDSTSTVDYDFASTNGWYVDISDADYIDNEETSENYPQQITFFQAPNTLLSKKHIYLNAYSDSGLDLEFTTKTPKVCSPVNWTNKIKLISAGSCKIVARQGGDDGYDAADDVTMTFSVLRTAPKTKVVAKPTPVPTPTKKAPGTIGGKKKN